MEYTSTRNRKIRVSAAETIVRGISEEGGLFVPLELPKLAAGELAALAEMDYEGRARAIFGKFLTDFSESEIEECVRGAYLGGRFENDIPDPLVKLGENTYMLELWHGPTCAFKDVALQILPLLMTKSAKKTGDAEDIVILVATSGDTGKAALEGFCDVSGTEIMVFYPSEGVSVMQRLQMATQRGENVSVCAVRGNFDDTQTAVKQIFTDEKIKAEFAARGKRLSSANSINFGRLLPQVVYYVSAYANLLADGEIANGESINVVVPTGNFGNILAAYYAKRMGVPIAKLICASNSNNVLTDFITTGTYDRNRDFYATESPSMDILISSNLERLLYLLLDGEGEPVSALMKELTEAGKYSVPDSVKATICEEFSAGWCNDKDGAETIKKLFDEYSYLCDTHTAVAVKVYEDYVKSSGDKTKAVIVSTASPYKFPGSVLKALEGSASKDEFVCAEQLAEKTGLPLPKQLKELSVLKPRFIKIVEKEDMCDFVFKTALSAGGRA